MLRNEENPFLLFEFANEVGEKIPYAFQQPIAIYETEKIEEIAWIFKKLEEACSQGYYVAGCLSYEAAPAFDASLSVHEQSEFPLVWFGVFEKPLHYEEEKNLDGEFTVSDWEYDISYSEYQEKIEKIKSEIATGNTSQINYTSRLLGDFTGDDYTFYKQLSRNQQASYTAYLNLGRYRILSASPELFFRIKGEKIITKPMKGTIKRGRSIAEDKVQKRTLANSKKDQTENAIIIEVLKSDLAKIAKPGTVRVSKTFELETYPTVHQMTSTVEAKIEQEKTIFDWFTALFPSGSITGAPKEKTMDYIQTLEKSPRGIYCGAIGFITPEKEAIFNVPIRTVLLDAIENKAIYGVGGGITEQSTAAGEYEEMVVKAKLLTERHPVYELLESLALIDGEYHLLERHLERLQESARYFEFQMDETQVRYKLEKVQKRLATGSYKVRLLLNKNGFINVTYSEIHPLIEPIICNLAAHPIDEDDVFYYHKTTNREIYEKHEKGNNDCFSTLLWNNHGEVTEFTTGNIVVQINGKLYTPPLESGLLAGTYRQELLDKGEIIEKVIQKNELTHCEAVYFINSVRGSLKVNMI